MQRVTYFLFGLALVASASSLANERLVVAEIGVGLDDFVVELIAEYQTGATSRPFRKLRAEIEGVFQSTPTILRLIEVQQGLLAEIDKAQAINNARLRTQLGQGYRVNQGASDGGAGAQSITASKPIYDFGAHEQTVTQAEALVDSERAQLEIARSSALLNLIQARLGLSSASDNLELTKQFVTSRSQFETFVEERRDLGASSDSDLIRATAKALEAQGELPPSKQTVSNAIARYVELFGRSAPEPVRFKLPVLDPLNVPIDTLVEAHPEVESQRRALDAAEAELMGFQRSRLGTFVFESSVTRSENPGTPAGEQFNVQIIYQRDLIDGGSTDAEIRQLESQVSELNFELRQAVDARIRSIQEARSAHRASLELLSIKIKSLQAARRSNQVTKELFAFDRGSLNDIFDAQDDYLSAAQSVVAELGQTQITFYQLLHESGLLLDQFQDAI